MDNNSFENKITTSPYNTLNLPPGEGPNLTNPQFSSPTIYENTNPRQNQRIPLGTEINFYDPTTEMVNDYLKTNISMYDNRGKEPRTFIRIGLQDIQYNDALERLKELNYEITNS